MADIVPPLSLRSGPGGDYANGLCVMEAVAWMASEGATDHPECACPVLGAFAIRLNDRLNDENRQKLKPLILPLTGSRSKAHEQARVEYLVLAVTTRILPQVFEARWPEHAKALRECKTMADVKKATANAAAYAAAYATDAANATRQDLLLQCIPILREAIMLGPNGADKWPVYEPRAKALAEFLTREDAE